MHSLPRSTRPGDVSHPSRRSRYSRIPVDSLQTGMLLDDLTLKIRVERYGDCAALKLSGELDYASVGELRRVLLEETSSPGHNVEMDMADVTFIDSMGLSLLLQAKYQVEANGGTMSLTLITDRVRRVLELANLDADLAS
jgi:anti-sigma B factor antagonist